MSMFSTILRTVLSDAETIQCDVTGEHQVFPNVDFALMGYHILKGFPLTTGTDSGLTKPVFKKEYTDGMMSSNGVYLVPNGLEVAQDIGCMTAFSTQIIKDVKELDLYLGSIVRFEASGWGRPFSANSHYRNLVHRLQEQKKYLIISSLTCQIYKATIDVMGSPSLDEQFQNWITQLATLDQESDILEFLALYGTHCLHRITYGAKYFYIYSIKTAIFNQIPDDDISIFEQGNYASMARLFPKTTVAGTWKETIEEFNKKVEVDSIALGVIPPTTDATDWYELIKAQPMPIAFELQPMEDVLIKSDLDNTAAVNLAEVRQKLNHVKMNRHMAMHQSVVQRSCVVHNSVLSFPQNSCIRGGDFQKTKHNYLDCMNLCMDRDDCLAVSHYAADDCKLFMNSEQNLDSIVIQNLDGPCRGIVLPYKISMTYTFAAKHDVVWFTITGITIQSKTAIAGYNFSRSGCQETCLLSKTACVGISYHSTSICLILTSFDIITGNLTVNGDQDSFVSFMKLC